MIDPAELASLPDHATTERMWGQIAASIAPRHRRRHRVPLAIALDVLVTATSGVTAFGAYARPQPAGTTAPPLSTSASWMDAPYMALPTSVALSPDQVRAQVRAQGVLGGVAQQINRVINTEKDDPALRGTSAQNFGSLVIDSNPEAPGIDLYWAGPVPASIRTVIEANRATRIRVHHADYSIREQQDAMSRVHDASVSGATHGRVSFLWAVPATDGSRVIVAVGALSPGVTEAEVTPAIRRAAGMPVVVILQALGSSDVEFHDLGAPGTPLNLTLPTSLTAPVQQPVPVQQPARPVATSRYPGLELRPASLAE